MATTFDVISLGNFASIDPTEGNTVAESSSVLVGETMGSAGSPLYENIQTLSLVDSSGGFNSLYEQDNNTANDTFSIDGGPAQIFDASAVYNVTITYLNGATETVSLILFQDTAGNTYLSPGRGDAALEVGPIQSISINSVFGDNYGGLGTSPTPVDFVTPVDGTAGSDTIDGGFIDIDGDQVGVGDDAVFAGGGDDVVLSGDGDDFIEGGTGADTITAGTGDDLIRGGDGNDSIVGTGEDGNDTIFGDDGNDWIDAGNQTDSVEGGAGDDTILSDWGSNTLSGGDGHDLVAGGGNSDSITGGTGNDTLYGDFDPGDAAMYNVFGAGDYIDAGAGDDVIEGGFGADTLIGGDGDDSFVTRDGFGNDTIMGGEGGTDDDAIDLSAVTGPVSVVYSGSEAGTITDGTDTLNFSQLEGLTLSDQADSVDASNDSAGFSANLRGGDDSALGGSGADTLSGGRGGDTILGGAGDDVIDGEGELLNNASLNASVSSGFQRTTPEGWQSDSGNSEIWASGHNSIISSDGSNIFELDGFGGVVDNLYQDVETTAGEVYELTLTARARDSYEGESIEVYWDGALVETITITDSSQWQTFSVLVTGDGNPARLELREPAAESNAGGPLIDTVSLRSVSDDSLLGGDGADTIMGGGGNNYLDGGTGNDLLTTDGGQDTLIGGAGNDTIDGGANDDLIGGGSGDDCIEGGDGADTIVLSDGFGNDTISGGDGGTNNDEIDLSALSGGVTVAHGSFGGGSITDGVDLVTFSGIEGLILTGSGDVFSSTNLSDLATADVDGGAGDDTITGARGAHTLRGGDGDDHLYSGDGSSTLIGGTGNDTLYANFYTGVINTNSYIGGDGIDFVVIDGTPVQGYSYNINLVTGSDTYGNTYSGIENITSGAGDDTLIGDGANNTLAGGDGNDLIDGGAGDDFLITGLGQDTLLGGAGNDTLMNSDGDDSLDGGAGDDSIVATGGEDTLRGGTGSDTMDGGDDADTFIIEDGFGNDVISGGEGVTDGTDTDDDVIDLSALSGAVTVTYTGDEAGTITDGTDTITFSEIERIILSDFGDQVDGSGISAQPVNLDLASGNDTVIGTGLDDTIAGGDGDDLIAGGDGDDLLTTGLGNDTLIGGQGNDTLMNSDGDDSLDGGAGDDSIVATGGEDTLRGGAGADTMEGGDDADTFIIEDGFGNDVITGGEGTTDPGDQDFDVIDLSAMTGPVTVTYTGAEAGTITDGTDTITFSEIEQVITTDQADVVDASGQTGTTGINVDTRAGDDTITGGNNADTIQAGDGDDSVAGGSGADSIDGGTGADTITGDAGNDTIHGGAGADSIDGGGSADSIEGGDDNDTLSGGGGNDTLRGGDGDDTLLGGTGDDSIDGGAGADSIEAGDGNDFVDYAVGGDTVDGGAGNDTIRGGFSKGTDDAVLRGGDGDDDITTYGADDTVYGDAGNDFINADSGDELIDGGADNDTIFAGGGDDTITGGTGDDSITGGAGNDIFHYAPGDGLDTITDFNTGNTGTLDDGDTTNNDFIDLSSFYDNLQELYADQADDGVLNQSNTVDGAGRTVDYSDNSQFSSGEGITFQGASADNSSFTAENTAVTCFTTGTAIRTPRGDVAIDDLRVGDLVMTLDNGAQPVRWIGTSTHDAAALRAHPHLRPVLIARGRLGNNRDLLVSRQHGMLVAGGLARAIHLTDTPGIRIANGKRQVTYLHLMFDAHQVIFAENAASESFYPGSQAMMTISPMARLSLLQAFPDLTPDLTEQGIAKVYGGPARTYLHRRDVNRHMSGPHARLGAPNAGLRKEAECA